MSDGPGQFKERIVCDPDKPYLPNGYVRTPGAGDSYESLSQIEFWMIAKPAYDSVAVDLKEALKILSYISDPANGRIEMCTMARECLRHLRREDLVYPAEDSNWKVAKQEAIAEKLTAVKAERDTLKAEQAATRNEVSALRESLKCAVEALGYCKDKTEFGGMLREEYEAKAAQTYTKASDTLTTLRDRHEFLRGDL